MITVDARAFSAALGKMMTQSKRDLGEVLKEQARGVIKRAIAITPPSNGQNTGAAAKRLGEKAVESDLLRIFNPLDPAEYKGELAANGGFRLRRVSHADNRRGAKLTDIDIFLKPSDMPRFHQNQRRSKGRVTTIRRENLIGRKYSDVATMGFVTWQDFRAYVKTVNARIGMLAAGWLRAAAALGVRGVPAWIGRHSSIPGSVRIDLSRDNMSITATNGARFAGNVRGLERRIQSAVDYQAQAMERRIAFATASAAKRAGFKTT